MPKPELLAKSGSSGKSGSSASSVHAGPSSLPNNLAGSSRGLSSSKTKAHARHSSRSRAGRSSTTHPASLPDMLPAVSPHSHSHSHSQSQSQSQSQSHHHHHHHAQAHAYPRMHRKGTDSNDSSKSSDSDDREEKESRPARTPSRHRRGSKDSESPAFRDLAKPRSAPIPIPRKKNAYGNYDSGDIDDIDDIYKNVSLADFKEARFKTDADYPPIELHEKPETVHGTNRFIPPHIIRDRTRAKQMARSVGRTKTPYYWE